MDLRGRAGFGHTEEQLEVRTSVADVLDHHGGVVHDTGEDERALQDPVHEIRDRFGIDVDDRRVGVHGFAELSTENVSPVGDGLIDERVRLVVEKARLVGVRSEETAVGERVVGSYFASQSYDSTKGTVDVKSLFRRIRGAIGLGLAWGFAWFAAGMALLLVVGPDAADVPFPLGFGLLGFLAGTTFGGILGLVERRRRFDEMSIPRFSLWGGVGGVLFSGIFVTVAGLGSAIQFLAPIFGLAGAACAAGTLVLARAAEDPDLLDSRDLADDVGLTEKERRELLGGGSD